MSTSFASLKKSRTESFDKLAKQLQDSGNNYSSDDGNYWKLETDKTGNGSAIIRFLPEPDGEDFPYVKMWNHGFKGEGGWYIENSLSTIGQDDPLSEYNSKLWNSGVESNKELARKQKRKLSYHCNIYVVKDPANPANEGKVFCWRFGKKIFEKIKDAMTPAFEDEAPMNPFNLWEGADFKLKQREVEGWPNYDKSEFSTPGVLVTLKGIPMTDEELEVVWKSAYSLKDIIDPKNFKSYDVLKAKLHKALGLTTTKVVTHDDEVEARSEPQATRKDSIKTVVEDDDDDDTMAFFKALAAED